MFARIPSAKDSGMNISLYEYPVIRPSILIEQCNRKNTTRILEGGVWMKRQFLVSCAIMAVTAPSPGSAQVRPQLTVDSVICKLAGTCGELESKNETSIEDRGKLVGKERVFTFVTAKNDGSASADAATEDEANLEANNNARLRAPSGRVSSIREDGNRYASLGQAVPTRSADMLVTFRIGSAEMTTQALENASIVARALQSKQLGGSQFLVEGHTDASGSRSYNIELSKRRALAVMEFLIDQGISPGRLRAAGYGFDRLRVPERPTDASNRRVQILKID